MAEDELIEALAEQEHASWARWMAYLFSKCQRGRDGSMTMPADYVRHWEREVSTPYAALSDAAKQSNREEVAHILPIIRQAAQADEPRAIVRAFALAMERKLAANDGGKGNWHDDGEWNHLLYAEAEMDELKQAMADYRNALATMFQAAIFPDENAAEKQRAAVETAMQRVNDLKQAVLDEAADVANYLMFACDVIGALPKTDERGR